MSTLQAHLPPSIALLYAWPIARECEARRNVDKRFARKEEGKKKSAARYSMEFVKTIGFVKGANLVASDGNHSNHTSGARRWKYREYFYFSFTASRVY